MKGKLMKKDKKKKNEIDMKDEYDFSKGVRGKHYKDYREGHTVVIHKEDGTKSIQFFRQEEGAIMFDPDVKIHFPDSESVDKALRSLIGR
jgi:hypothetical protein